MEPLGLALVLLMGASAGLTVKLEERTRPARRRRRVRRWQAVARGLGLDWHPKLSRASGWLGGRYVAAWLDGMSTRVDAMLWPPMDLGLSAAASVTRAYEPGRAKALLAGPVGKLLSKTRWSSFVADDRVVITTFDAVSTRELKKMIAFARELARTVDQRRGDVPVPPRAVELTEDWGELARTLRLQGSDTPRALRGVARGLGVLIFLRRRGSSNWSVVVMAEFRAPLEIGFRATSHAVESSELWSLSPMSTGDREFDAAFRVSAFERDFVTQALSPAARARACEIAQAWKDVSIDDYGVRVEAVAANREKLEQMLEAALSTAELVDFVHPKREGAGAYR